MKNLNRTHNLIGERFGKLTVIGLDDKGTRKTYWVCQCDCGNIKSIRSDALVSNITKSCGCLKKEQDKVNLTANHSHKQSRTRLYTIWQGMKDRCCNPHNVRYERYGGRGIKVCDEWKNGFQNFYNWAIENGYSENLTIDRIDNDGDYSPRNCRWANLKEQSRNRSTNINITIGNATKTLTEWCEIFKLDYNTIEARYKRNGFIGINELFN